MGHQVFVFNGLGGFILAVAVGVAACAVALVAGGFFFRIIWLLIMFGWRSV